MEKLTDSFFDTLKKIKETILDEDSEDERGSNASSEHHQGIESPEKNDPIEQDSEHTKSENAPKLRKITPNYESSSKKGDSTLLAISQQQSSGPNTETQKRFQSMRMAGSMQSVYRKINKDKNIHNDRHYLVSVTEQIKTDETTTEVPVSRSSHPHRRRHHQK